MSYMISSINKRDTCDKRQARQPFCKVCFDAKRPDYNTHFLKDFTGPHPVVLCPYLLALTCNYCKEQGHTVSYCEILKAKKASKSGGNDYESNHQNKVPSQNGHFFIMRVSNNGVQTISHSSNSRKGVAAGSSSSVSGDVSTSNPFALLEHDDDVCEQPKRKDKNAVSFVTQEAVAVAVVEPESLLEVEQTAALPTWAKIVSMPPPKKQTAPVSAKESLNTNVKSVIALSSLSTATPEPAAFKKPIPVSIHNPSTETKPKYFIPPPYKMSNWADESSEEDSC